MNISAQAAPVAGELRRLRLEARGTVQGVGFRPHAYRTALALGLAGHVRNHGDGVSIEVEGHRADEFEGLFLATLPPLARVEELTTQTLNVCGDREFVIERSDTLNGQGSGAASVPADVGICDSCLHELFDADNRRYLHPFIACCDCGPRYTMARHLPYDRATTSMADFMLCDACADEYVDPHSRRLHAEPIACHDCGPALSSSVASMADALRSGKIVAIKGIGGYHLACDARSADAVELLRTRKRRDGRPFAVMVLNARSADAHVRLSPAARAALEAPERPVVIADRQPGFGLPEALAPGLDTLGVMLPYTALHYLLFHALAGEPDGHGWLQSASTTALVMTSANISGEPMLTDDIQAHARMALVADLVVSHDRFISHGCDDSVLRATEDAPIMVRRGRGFAPGSVNFVEPLPTVLAVGAHLKNTVCATRGREAFLSPHIGDLESPSMHGVHKRTAQEICDWLRIEPEAIACDLHPDYASTRLANQMADELGIPLIPVQHHHAHIAAVAAAHEQQAPILGLALDGHGMGEHGESWGGELFRIVDNRCERLSHLRPLPVPGGDRAAREPWRLAAAVAAHLDMSDELSASIRNNLLFDAVQALSASDECPTTTACGRYFDAAAALLNLCHKADYEAEAPMRLESQCRGLREDPGLFHIDEQSLDLYPLLGRLPGIDDPGDAAALFHGTLIRALSDWVARAAEATDITTVALSGGCFLNAVVATELPAQLRAQGLSVLTGWDRLTPGDGSISLGQAWVAANQIKNEVYRDFSITEYETGGTN